MKTHLKPGSLVYRVSSLDFPDDNKRHTWKAFARTVKSASDRMIILESNFPDLMKTRYTPNALGRVFFATPGEAIGVFMKAEEGAIASANRKIIEASRALAWCRAELKGEADAVADGSATDKEKARG